MSDSTKAVFLSYASQDAEAAKRICEALRAAGVEVWFDQSELRGGDAWDQRIRKQIKECALFVPVISPNTQARAEGYFRLEWRLADQRTHLMGKSKPFLVPVAIDRTSEADADVPDSFTEVQWTRLKDGEGAEKFGERVKTLLGGGSSPHVNPSVAPLVAMAPESGRRKDTGKRWLLPAIAGGIIIALLAVVMSRPWEKASPPSGSAKPALPVQSVAAPVTVARPASAADKLVERATTILDGSALSREQIDAANGLLEQAIALEPTNAAAWTAAARADLMLIHPYGYDRTEERRQRAMSRATRALNLAPDSFATRVVRTAVMAHASGNPALTKEAEETFRRMSQERPDDRNLKVQLAEVLREEGRFDEAAALFAQIGEFELAGWSWSQAGNFAAAYESVKRAVIEKRTTTALELKSMIEIDWFEDLGLAQATVDQLSPSELQSEIVVSAATRLAFYRRDSERMLQLLNALSHDFLDSNGFVGPRQYWTGWAHRLAGRTERAKIEWRKAVTVLQAERATAPDRVRLFVLEAEIHALLGETEEAERLLASAQSIANETPGTITVVNVGAFLALGKKEPVLAWLDSFLRGRPDRRFERAHPDARFSPIWDGLRGDPRFEALLRETKPKDAVPFDDPKPAAAP